MIECTYSKRLNQSRPHREKRELDSYPLSHFLRSGRLSPFPIVLTRDHLSIRLFQNRHYARDLSSPSRVQSPIKQPSTADEFVANDVHLHFGHHRGGSRPHGCLR
jgi:hypothetical protein